MFEYAEQWSSVFHVGAGKCGSSSVQRALSLSPRFASSDGSRRYRYFVLLPNGQLAPWRIKRRMASNNQSGLASHAFKEIFFEQGIDGQLTLNLERAAQVKALIQSEVDANSVPVFSNEGTLNLLKTDPGLRLFQALKVNPLICVYIRPQVELINSAWWQWGVWGKLPFDVWLEQQILRRSNWYRAISCLHQLPFPKTLHIGVCSENVVGNFFERLGVNLAPEILNTRTNTTLSTDAISFLLRNRKYRPGPHSSRVDFILGDFEPFKNSPIPWCLKPNAVKKITDHTRENNLKLLKLLPESVAAQIHNDPNWWDPGAYSNRNHWDWASKSSSDEKRNDTAAHALLYEKGMN